MQTTAWLIKHIYTKLRVVFKFQDQHLPLTFVFPEYLNKLKCVLEGTAKLAIRHAHTHIPSMSQMPLMPRYLLKCLKEISKTKDMFPNSEGPQAGMRKKYKRSCNTWQNEAGQLERQLGKLWKHLEELIYKGGMWAIAWKWVGLKSRKWEQDICS